MAYCAGGLVGFVAGWFGCLITYVLFENRAWKKEERK